MGQKLVTMGVPNVTENFGRGEGYFSLIWSSRVILIYTFLAQSTTKTDKMYETMAFKIMDNGQRRIVISEMENK